MASTDLFPAPAGLSDRARAAYAWGRARLGLAAALRAALVAAAALALGQGRPDLLLCGAALVALAAAFAFHGRAPGRAVGPGLVGAAAAALSPLLLHAAGAWCGIDACYRLCVPACALGGAAAGLLIGLRVRDAPDPAGARTTLACGMALIAVAAPLGCAMLGSAGLLATALGVAAGTAPALARAAR